MSQRRFFHSFTLGIRAASSVMLALSAVLFGTVVPLAHAATITVTTTDDELNQDGDCSLREAIRAANLDLAIDACPAGNGADMIVVLADTYTLTLANLEPDGEDAALTGDLDITGDVTIRGAGAGVTTLDGNALDRLLEIAPGAVVVIEELTLRHGNGGAGPDEWTPPSGTGGAIRNRGTLTLSLTLVTENTAPEGGNSTYAGVGGGIYNDRGAHLSIQDSRISNNGARRAMFATGILSYGGGIYNAGTLLITRSTISDNVSGDNGGGVSNDGSAQITSSTVSGNSSRYGGGIANAGMLTFSEGTVSGNTAAVLSEAQGTDGSGGGIGNRGTLTLTNSTISGNSALIDSSARCCMVGRGGGIRNDGTLTLDGVTITSNMAHGFEDLPPGGGVSNGFDVNSLVANPTLVHNTIVAGNNEGASDWDGELASTGYNLIGNTADTTIVGVTTGNLLNVDATLGVLADNGGSTLTHALLPGSPAVDSGDPGACPATDQRGIPRPQDGNKDGSPRCDIGAFELAAATSPTARQQISVLKADVQHLVMTGVLNRGQGNALTAKLSAAQQSLARDHKRTAVNQLHAFGHQVEAFAKAKILSPEQGQDLLEQVNPLIAQLGG